RPGVLGLLSLGGRRAEGRRPGRLTGTRARQASPLRGGGLWLRQEPEANLEASADQDEGEEAEAGRGTAREPALQQRRRAGRARVHAEEDEQTGHAGLVGADPSGDQADRPTHVGDGEDARSLPPVQGTRAHTL